MRQRLIAVLAILSLPLASCASLAPVAVGPGVVASQTALDEKTLLAVELGYKGARTAMELAVDLGRLKGENAGKAQVFNRRAYAAVLAMRAAYRAGNSSTWLDAYAEAQAAIAGILSLSGGSN